MKTAQPPSVTIRQIEFELEKAEHGMGLPYDAERVGQLRKMLVEARKRKLSAGLKARRKPQGIGDDANRPERRSYFPPTSTITRISEVPRVFMRVPDTRRVNVSGP
jgi:hypothetical protein